MKSAEIATEYIRLDSFLKYVGICSTGGHAKIIIAEGDVLINGQACLERGRKLRGNDIVKALGNEYIVKNKE